MAGYDPLTGNARWPLPGESLMERPSEASPAKPKAPKRTEDWGLFHQFDEEERDDLLRRIGQSWLGPEEEASATGEAPFDFDQTNEYTRRIMELIGSSQSAARRGAGAPVDPSEAHGGSPPRGIDHLMNEIDNAADQHDWPEEEKENARKAIEAFMDDDEDLYYEDLALAWTGDLPGGHGIAYKTNASGEFENDEVAVYYPETGQTEYFTSSEWADMIRG